MKNVVKIIGNLFIPYNYHGNTSLIMPDEVVEYCSNYFDLLKPNSKIIDPMCGLGTIPRVINRLGGNCIGVEIDKYNYQIAAGVVGGKNIYNNDFRSLPFEKDNFACVFTSMPFAWFKDERTTANLDNTYATTILKLLSSDGFLLVDSIPEVKRDDGLWPVSRLQEDYLKKNGFTIKEKVFFETETHVDSSAQSTVTKFVPNK